MRAFGKKISGNRRSGGELSTQQREHVLAQTEAGAWTKILPTLLAARSTASRRIQQWDATGGNESHPRSGRTPVLISIDRRLLLRLTKKFPKVEYRRLLEEAGMWPAGQDHKTFPATLCGASSSKLVTGSSRQEGDQKSIGLQLSYV
jgi:hypothetical protein